MRRPLVRDQRGSVLIFTTALLVFLLVFTGLAVDLTFYMSAQGELQKSLDAAALAGAGKLGFDDSVFPTVRTFARDYSLFNGIHGFRGAPSTVALDLNTVNADTGDIVLGIWDPTKPQGFGPGQRFEPSTDGTIVNAVLCRKQVPVDTTFLRLLGFNGLTVGSFAVAVANPPSTPPPDGCLFPIGVGSCPFEGPTSKGCGSTITFITSSGKDEGAGCLAPPCTNTAAWVNLAGGNVNTPYLRNAIANAAGSCPPSPLKTGDTIEAGNGMVQTVMNDLETAFVNKYNTSETYEITDEQGNITYAGKGWKVYIPIIETACPAGAISGGHTIVGWTEFVMTQVINKGDCAVANHWGGNQWDPIGKSPNCLGTNTPPNSGALRAIFGYYSCTIIPANPVPEPLPRSALATRLRLVR
jgi:Putative Flp pilus-assembly TadE/G-like